MIANRAAFAPGVLWSLHDLVEQYRVGELVDLQSFVSSAATNFGGAPQQSPIRFQPDQMALFKAKLSLYVVLLESLDLPVSIKAAKVAIECLERVRAGPDLLLEGQNRADFIGSIGKLADIVGDEMEVKLFLAIPAHRSAYFDQSSPLFGDEVSVAFPAAVEDISEAGKCFALGRNTAAVFHVMRAMEVAVQVIGGKLGATVSDNDG